jgi:hypothetical protein
MQNLPVGCLAVGRDPLLDWRRGGLGRFKLQAAAAAGALLHAADAAGRWYVHFFSRYAKVLSYSVLF